MESTGDRDLDWAIPSAFHAMAWEMDQVCRETRAKIDVIRCELLVHGIAGLTPPPSPIRCAVCRWPYGVVHANGRVEYIDILLKKDCGSVDWNAPEHHCPVVTAPDPAAR